MQVSNFGGTFDQLFLWNFSWNFHRRCLFTFSIPWCKNVQNMTQKRNSRGFCLNHRTTRAGSLDLNFWSFLTFCTMVIDKIETHLQWKFHKEIQCKPARKVLVQSCPQASSSRRQEAAPCGGCRFNFIFEFYFVCCSMCVRTSLLALSLNFISCAALCVWEPHS